jgi:hypothetical protein
MTFLLPVAFDSRGANKKGQFFLHNSLFPFPIHVDHFQTLV